MRIKLSNETMLTFPIEGIIAGCCAAVWLDSFFAGVIVATAIAALFDIGDRISDLKSK